METSKKLNSIWAKLQKETQELSSSEKYSTEEDSNGELNFSGQWSCNAACDGNCRFGGIDEDPPKFSR